jgi:hypothetical protein
VKLLGPKAQRTLVSATADVPVVIAFRNVGFGSAAAPQSAGMRNIAAAAATGATARGISAEACARGGATSRPCSRRFHRRSTRDNRQHGSNDKCHAPYEFGPQQVLRRSPNPMSDSDLDRRIASRGAVRG